MAMLKDKVLVVDDDPKNLRIVEETLQDQCLLKLASSGEAALEEISKFKPDVVLLDIMMPGIDGYETCRRIKSDPDLRFTKILMVSAKALVNERLAGYEFGADDYIVKPFNDEELLAKVKVYLKLKFFEELDQLRRNTLKSISQNINKPLMSMFGSDFLLQQKDLQSTTAESLRLQLQGLHDNGRQLMEFCNKVMLLCELKDGKDLSFESVSVSEFIPQVIGRIQPQATEKQVEIFYRNSMYRTIDCDPQLIENALLFLLHNAITFSPMRSSILVSTHQINDMGVIEIEDQGENLMRRLFNELSTSNLDNDVNRAAEGVSMNIVDIIMKLHGGEFSYAKNSQGGVSFTLQIPLKSS